MFGPNSPPRRITVSWIMTVAYEDNQSYRPASSRRNNERTISIKFLIGAAARMRDVRLIHAVPRRHGRTLLLDVRLLVFVFNFVFYLVVFICSGGGKGGEGGRPPRAALYRGRHFRGENMEFLRLNCNVLA